MLYRGSEIVREVSWVVFDEIHYMRDKGQIDSHRDRKEEEKREKASACSSQVSNAVLALLFVCFRAGRAFCSFLRSFICCPILFRAWRGVGGDVDFAARSGSICVSERHYPQRGRIRSMGRTAAQTGLSHCCTACRPLQSSPSRILHVSLISSFMVHLPFFLLLLSVLAFSSISSIAASF